MEKYLKRILAVSWVASLLIIIPSIVHALTVKEFICQRILVLVNPIVTVLTAGAILVFFWGVVIYIAKANRSESREEGAKFMLYGVIAIFILTSYWGFVVILRNSFSVGVTPPSVITGGC